MSAFTLPSRYPGLFWMSKFIGPYFPKTKYYVETFSGLARTAKHSRSEIMILNDKSEYANNQCRKKFPNAMITNQDFETCIKRWDSKDTFFLIDPPWRLDYYDNKDRSFIDRTVPEYLDKLQEILALIKGHYIITLDQYHKFKSPYTKLAKYHKPVLFGKYPLTKLYSNKPLEIHIPQIMDYV